jgi:hypothetical protein
MVLNYKQFNEGRFNPFRKKINNFIPKPPKFVKHSDIDPYGEEDWNDGKYQMGEDLVAVRNLYYTKDDAPLITKNKVYKIIDKFVEYEHIRYTFISDKGIEHTLTEDSMKLNFKKIPL